MVLLIAALSGCGQVHSATIEISMLDAVPTIDGTVDSEEWSAAAVVDEYFVQIEKENIQALWVWRFKPPFGSLQLAYQTGTSEQGQVSEQGDTFFAKLSWVF